MKIGDEVYVHGFIDEIRPDTIIIENRGGYFGTVKNEIVTDIKAIDKENFSSYWIVKYEGNGWNDWENLICPICNTKFEDVAWPSTYNYCPNCGASLIFKRK